MRATRETRVLERAVDRARERADVVVRTDTVRTVVRRGAVALIEPDVGVGNRITLLRQDASDQVEGRTAREDVDDASFDWNRDDVAQRPRFVGGADLEAVGGQQPVRARLAEHFVLGEIEYDLPLFVAEDGCVAAAVDQAHDRSRRGEPVLGQHVQRQLAPSNGLRFEGCARACRRTGRVVFRDRASVLARA